MKKLIFILSLLANLMFIIGFGYFIHKKGGVTYLRTKMGLRSEKTFSPKHNNYWNRKYSLFQVLPNDSTEIIFLGNSITEWCEWSELLENPNIKNRGISGDNTIGLLDRLDEVVESQPKKIFIEVGINDIKILNTYEIAHNYESIIQIIKQESPSTNIYLQSIIPTNFFDTFHPDTIRALNNQIKRIASENSLIYIDLHDLFLDEKGNFDMTLSYDGIHPNGKGYLVWKKAVEPFVNEP